MKGRENLAISKENPFKLVSENANLALHALSKHAQDRSKMAMVYESVSGSRQVFSFFEIEQFSNKIANLLQNLGSGKGDRIFTLLNRTPELYATIPAVLKLGAAIAVLFPDFGSEAIRQRLEDAGARILITDSANLEKVRPLCGSLPTLEHILVIGENREKTVAGVQFHNFDKLLKNASNRFESAIVSEDDTCFLIYTSGTTGLPKGVVHRHAIRERLTETAQSVLQLEKSDFYWCTADPGWVTGLNYGIFAPWLLGMPILVYEGEFDAHKWLDILERNQVTCLYTTPTLLRLMRNEIGDISQKRDFALTRIFSAGEPLNTEVISWAERVFDAPIYDNYWQTETGSQIIANRPNVPVRRGSMGKAVEGVQVAIIDEKGKIVPSGVVGDIAIRPTLNSLFKGYWNFPEATRACFRAGWYITRDRGKLDENGYFWFVARNDDVITCEAQRIGPFEVENALLSHPAVAESAAIGVADVVTTEHVKAFIVLRKGYEATEKLAKEIANHVLAQLSPLATPKEIEFVSDLPKTKSGKIQRDQLRRKGSFDNEKVFIIE
ncbi:MAG: AMP-binding protein [Pyrinomonadaceae bacterium]|nr:AMP-binding protein [Pyrinomonadaceae bacterium]